ncbi:MAG: hypothetical protein AABN34_14745 [Acidobacteriota bacterium]
MFGLWRKLRVELIVPSAPADAGKPERDVALDLYKMEYERGAERYENIYKALWTNFSYMALVSGAILTFGGARFEPEFCALLACLPLLFWWIASYEPLNHYGDHVAERLDWIEIILNETYGLCTPYQQRPAGMPELKWKIEQHKGLGHFREFGERKQARKHGADLGVAPAAPPPQRKLLEPILGAAFAAIVISIGVFLAFKVGGLSQGRTPFRAWVAAAVVWAAWVVMRRRGKIQWEDSQVTFLERFQLAMLSVLRVRNAVRVFFILLLLVALMLAYRVMVHFPIEGKSFILQKPAEVKVVAIGLKDASGNIKLLELNPVEKSDSLNQGGESAR